MARKKEISISGNMPLPGRNTPGTVIITAPRLFMKDMADYMQAVRGANNVDFTQRTRLYDLYEDILMDGHTGSVIEKRKSAVQCSQIEFRRNGVPDEGINTLLRSPWFYRFIGDLIDSDFWGFSLFQFYKNLCLPFPLYSFSPPYLYYFSLLLDTQYIITIFLVTFYLYSTISIISTLKIRLLSI